MNQIIPSRLQVVIAVTCCWTISLSSGCNTGVPLGAGFGSQPTRQDANTPAPSAGAEQIARDIEEADVVKVAGSHIYVLNPYKGLIIVNASNPDAPAVVGRLDLRGRGVEMYVVGQRVYVILSADFGYYPPDGVVPLPATARVLPPAPDFTGSQLGVIDVSDPANPTLRDKLNLVGYASASRRVGDVIYVIGSTDVGYYFYAAQENAPLNRGFVASINVADPDNVIAVERKTFSGNGLLLHVSQTALFAASQLWDPNAGQSFTNIQYVDISDPAGQVAVRGSVRVPGFIRNRFYMDDWNGALRVASELNGFGSRQVRLYTYNLANPDDIQPLGQVNIIRGESLEAVRFDGARGYAVTFLRVDPLFVLDLSDPANPAVTGQLKVPGYSTHIEPRGERLIAVGIDDTNGQRPAVSYYDVSDPANPTELSRVVLGPPGSFTESDATYDEKAFKIVDDLGLIVIPFRHADPDTGPFPLPGGGGTTPFAAREGVGRGCVNGVQLVEFSDAGLSKRGYFDHRGKVNRVGVIGPRLFAVSTAALQTVNITNRDQPVMAGEAPFFPAAEMSQYADDCGYYFPFPIDTGPVIIIGPAAIRALFEALANSGLCGVMSVVPMSGMLLGMWLMRGSRIRRRR